VTGRRVKEPSSPVETVTLEPAAPAAVPAPRVLCLTVVDHPRPAALGRRAALAGPGELVIGRRAEWLGPDTFRDGRISREHARLRLDAAGQLTVEDLGSHNGTFVDGARVPRATLREGAVLSVGGVQVLVHRGPADHVPERGGPFVTASAAMAACVAQLDRWAVADDPLAIVGEPGSGRTSLAQRVHARRGGPFVTLGAHALPDELVATSLLGRERGAYPGADEAAPGLLEAASGGTLVLDGLEGARPALA
jgi:predicted component of type VI protein secretion system